MKKLLLLSICILAFTTAAFGQAKFSGEYLGPISPVRWTFEADERVLVDLFFYPDGTASLFVWTFDFDLITTADGSIDAAGRFFLVFESGAVLKGKVTGGIARGSTFGASGVKYTFGVGRRFKLPYDPSL